MLFDTDALPFYDASRAGKGKLKRVSPTMLSIPHMIVVFLVVLVVFGPQKLPELARSFGKLMAEFRKASNDFKSAFEQEMRDLERQARIAELKKQVAEATAAANTAMARAEAASAANPSLPPSGNGAPLTPDAAPDSQVPEGPVITPVAESVPRSDGTMAETAAEASTLASEPGANGAAEHKNDSSPSHDQQQPA